MSEARKINASEEEDGFDDQHQVASGDGASPEERDWPGGIPGKEEDRCRREGKNGAKKSKGRNNDGRDSPMVAEASTFNLAEQR